MDHWEVQVQGAEDAAGAGAGDRGKSRVRLSRSPAFQVGGLPMPRFSSQRALGYPGLTEPPHFLVHLFVHTPVIQRAGSIGRVSPLGLLFLGLPEEPVQRVVIARRGQRGLWAAEARRAVPLRLDLASPLSSPGWPAGSLGLVPDYDFVKH